MASPPEDGFDFVIDYGDSQERPRSDIPKLPFGDDPAADLFSGPEELEEATRAVAGERDPFAAPAARGAAAPGSGVRPLAPPPGAGGDPFQLDIELGDAPSDFDRAFGPGGGEVLETFPASDPKAPGMDDEGGFAEAPPGPDPWATAGPDPWGPAPGGAPPPPPFGGAPPAPSPRAAAAPAPAPAPEARLIGVGMSEGARGFDGLLREAARRAVVLHRELLGHSVVCGESAEPSSARALAAIRRAGLAEIDQDALGALLRKAQNG